MNIIHLLDCTLRDGGYINDWQFGERTIQHVVELLDTAMVDYVEIGYLNQKKCSNDYTLFSTIEKIDDILQEKKYKSKLVAMINYGDYPIELLEENTSNRLDAVRIAFHKRDLEAAFEYCVQAQNKGYEIFVQPMGTDNYSDREFIELIEKFNGIMPKVFYIVDSFGVIDKKKLVRYLSIADNNLDEKIGLGYHSHNNLQQAFGNAQYMVEQVFDRELYIDSSIYGMGRGAGNLNTELFAGYLNEKFDKQYGISIMLEIIDQYIGKIHMEKFWGYSLPYYLSAKQNCHPNYAKYYSEKNTMTNKTLDELLGTLSVEDKISFSEEKAEAAYRKFQQIYFDDKQVIEKIGAKIKEKEILVLAPGKSLEDSKEVIKEFIDNNNPIIISVNVANNNYKSDYIICTNEKRYKRIVVPDGCQLIISSNLGIEKEQNIINYSSYTCDEKLIADNPTIMLFNLLRRLGIKKITIAGFDGYSVNAKENYYDSELVLGTSLDIKLKKNELIKKELEKYKTSFEIEFLTKTLYN
jgi:4-hydroxy 2-oxovalerate aldolase